ncbi:hypothetical protein BsWGS_25367 [Bradybaena similaris]
MSEPPREYISAAGKVPDEIYLPEDASTKGRHQNPHRPRKLRLYVNGNGYFPGKKIYITPNRYHNFTDLLNDLTGKLPSNLNLHYGVRQIFTPRGGRKIHRVEELVDGETYVCAGFEAFRMVKYGRSELEPWSVAQSQQNPMTEPEPDILGVPPLLHSTNNAFHPGRYFRQSLSYPQRRLPDKPRPSPRGYAGVSVSDSMQRPKVITVIKNGPKPRNSIRILLNRRTIQPYEQMIADISDTFGSKLKTSKVHKLFTVRGREVLGVSDFFRGDEYFVAFGGGEASLSENEIVDILEELFQDAGLAKRLLLDWRKNERRRRKISPENRFLRSNRDHLHAPPEKMIPGQGQDKRDSGFDSGDISTNISEVEQIDRLGIVTMRRKNMMDRLSEKKNDVEKMSEERRPQFVKYYKPKYVNKGMSNAKSEEIVKLKARRPYFPEIERKAADDERRKKEVTPLINSGSHPTVTNNSRINEIKDIELVENVLENNLERKKTGLHEKSLDVVDTTVQSVKISDNALEETNTHQKEGDEKKGIELEEANVNNNKQYRDVELLEKPDIDQTVIAREMSVVVTVDKSVNNRVAQDISSDTAVVSVAQTANIPGSSVSECIPAQTDITDKNNNQKEKRKQDREDMQQRKRAKTKIVRKTKSERQVSSDEYVFSLYEMGRNLGDGNFAIVRHSRKKDTGQEFAIKVIDKAKLKGKNHMVENEIDILKDCCHHNIVRLYEEYETTNRIYLVMELVKGGDLFDAITQNVKFPEVESALMVKDLCNALFYMHSRRIVHRDLKPENLLVHRSKDGRISLKLADFGLAMEVKQLIYTVCGTPTYVAPEILTDIGYGLEVDMWAVGVITYILLCGFPPFRSPDRNQTELFEYIKAGDFEFISPYWDNTSRNAKDLISHLLVVDKSKRYTAIDVLCHKWVLCGGQIDVIPEGALTVDAAARQTRRELVVQAKLNYESYQRVKEKKKQELQRKEE